MTLETQLKTQKPIIQSLAQLERELDVQYRQTHQLIFVSAQVELAKLREQLINAIIQLQASLSVLLKTPRVIQVPDLGSRLMDLHLELEQLFLVNQAPTNRGEQPW